MESISSVIPEYLITEVRKIDPITMEREVAYAVT